MYGLAAHAEDLGDVLPRPPDTSGVRHLGRLKSLGEPT